MYSNSRKEYANHETGLLEDMWTEDGSSQNNSTYNI